MDIEKINKILAAIKASSVIQVDGGVSCESWELDDPVGEPENQILRVTWTDGEDDFEDIFTEEGFDKAVITENVILLDNYEGEPSTISLFNMKPHIISI